MGGKVSHEFMLLTDIGEDSIVTCPECGFRANMEACEAITENTADAELLPLEEVFTGEAKTIDEVGEMLGIDNVKSCKAVVYQRNSDDSYVLIFCRGDREVNETKLTNYLKSEIHPAVDIENANLAAGNIGPLWPITIAPWQVEICALRINDEAVKAAADKLYSELENAGVEVLYDDRPVSAGFMFSDADLLGAPVRVVISPKTLARGCFELAARDKSFGGDIPVQGAKQAVLDKIRELTEAVNAKVPDRM